MPETTSSTLSRVANVLGVSDKFAARGSTPIDNILRMQHFLLWGVIVLVIVIGFIVWVVQRKLDGIDKLYKEQYVLLHRLFKSHQDLQIKVHKPPVVITTAAADAATAATAAADAAVNAPDVVVNTPVEDNDKNVSPTDEVHDLQTEMTTTNNDADADDDNGADEILEDSSVDLNEL
jgi:hypothetical protein